MTEAIPLERMIRLAEIKKPRQFAPSSGLLLFEEALKISLRQKVQVS